MQTVSERKENFHFSRIINRKMENKINDAERSAVNRYSEDQRAESSPQQPTIYEAPPSYSNVIEQQAEIISNWNAQKETSNASAVTIQPMPNSQVKL